MGQSSSHSASSTSISAPACPVKHDVPNSSTSAKCPVAHDPPSKAAECPVNHESIDPRNQMPSLSQAPTPHQTIILPTEREESSIQRDNKSKWEYPSPQQFYNALARKGWETPEEHIETMVQIHNFLNEEAWTEVMKWEKRQYQYNDVQLTRLQGRPGDISPKARFWLFAGWLLPSRFNTEPPFDRHDWIVRRPQTGEEVRYIIDYYSAPPEPDGSPVFSLDVRPALDSFGSIKERITVATEDVWASFRQNPRDDETRSEPSRPRA
ncbi:cytochrome c and c1 heme-lyase [Amanita muscaria]